MDNLGLFFPDNEHYIQREKR